MNMWSKTYLFLLAAFVTLTGFTLTAHAAALIDPVDGSLDMWGSIYNAVNGGHYALAASASLVVAVALCRKWLGGYFQWMHTDAGSAVLVLLGSLGAALTGALAGGGPFTWHLGYSALLVAFTAAGGYAALKKLVIVPLAPRLPPWLRGPVLWLFEHKSDINPPDGNSPPTPGV